jgi:iron complex outermembrane receptor protein
VIFNKKGVVMTKTEQGASRKLAHKALRLCGAATVALLAAGAAGAAPAWAQTTAAADANADTLPTVVVTSRKKAENLQNVPLSVTALSADTLQNANVVDLRDIANLVPGLTFYDGGANYNSHPTIRGQVDQNTDVSSVNNVPVFINGVYISNPSAIDLGLIDLARVEVIKGPVSSTYGRSSYAGAINYITTPPSNVTRGYLEFTGGDYGKYNGRASISGPILGDMLKGGISGSYDNFDGTYHDSVTDQNAGGYVKRDVFANLDFTPNSQIEIKPTFYYGNDKYANAANIYGAGNCGAGFYASFCGKVPSGSSFVGPYIAAPGDYGQEGNARTVFSSSVTSSYKTDFGTFTSLTGMNDIKSNQYNEFDDQRYGALYPTFYIPAGYTNGQIPPAGVVYSGVKTGNEVYVPRHFGYDDKNHDFEEDLRYHSPTYAHGFDWTAGLYYASSQHTDNLSLADGTCNVPAGQYILSYFATPCGQVYNPQHTQVRQHDAIYAGYAGLDFDIIKNVTFSGEVREEKESEVNHQDYGIFDGYCQGFNTTCASPYITAAPEKATFWTVTTRDAITWKITPEVSVYGSIANGTKEGGFNVNTATGPKSYGPELNWTYELGVKSNLLDHRLQLDGDVFLINATNDQVTGPTGSLGVYSTVNAGSLNTPGVEVSAEYLVVPGVKVTAGVNYDDPKFGNNSRDYGFADGIICGSVSSCEGRIRTDNQGHTYVSIKGLEPNDTSDLTLNLGLDARHEIKSGWDWFGTFNYRYEDKMFYQYPIDTGYFGPANIVNLRTGVETGPYQISLYVKNATNDKTPTVVQDSYSPPATTYYPVAALPEGRTVGVTLHYKFGG